MARKVRTVMTGDLDGMPGAETVCFSVGSAAYEIDLTPANRQWLLASLQPFTNAGRRIGRGRSPAARTDVAEIRAWAQAQRLHVAEQGRIFRLGHQAVPRRASTRLSLTGSSCPENKP